jgi:hypothetical protein
VLEKMGYEDMTSLCKQSAWNPDCAIPQSPKTQGLTSRTIGVPSIKLLDPPLDEDPLYPHPHMAQQKLLGCLALPGGLFTLSRSLAYQPAFTTSASKLTSYRIYYRICAIRVSVDDCVNPVIEKQHHLLTIWRRNRFRSPQLRFHLTPAIRT